MADSRGASVLPGLALALLLTTACASGQPGSQSEPSASGDCAFDVRNQTNVTLSVTAGGTGVRPLGTLEPGGSVRFSESCDVDEVVVTATSAQTTEPGFGPTSRRSRDRMIQRTVVPHPDRVVPLPLRFPEQGTGGGGQDGPTLPEGWWGGSGPPVPPGPVDPPSGGSDPPPEDGHQEMLDQG